MQNEVVKEIRARQVLDSRGNPTVEADVFLESGAGGRAIVPSGASTGKAEAVELRDGNEKHYRGKGVLKAVWNINGKIRDVLVGNSAEQTMLDKLLIDLDGTENKASLGANAILAVSLATAKAVARARGVSFYRYIAELADTQNEMCLPMPMINVINGGAHANWVTDWQEYMIIPRSAETMTDAVRMGSEVFWTLSDVLKNAGLAVTVGDEGGYAPQFTNGNNEPLNFIKEAVEQAGYRFGEDVVLALDVAASEFWVDGGYELKTSGDRKSSEDLIAWYDWLVANYPVVSVEDGLAEDDYAGWKTMTQSLGAKLQLVGDDLFTTNTKLLTQGINEAMANAILIKPNQIGTLSETIATVKLAKLSGYRTIISHRSGETEDTSIAHLAVGLGAGQIKTGSLSRSERICKYNELLRIAEGSSTLGLAKPF